MATHSSIRAWRIPCTEEPGGLQSLGLQRVRHEAIQHTCKYVNQIPRKYVLVRVCAHSVVPDSLQAHGLQPVRLLCPWNSPGTNTGVGSHSRLQGTFPTQGSNLKLCGGTEHSMSIKVCTLPNPRYPLVVLQSLDDPPKQPTNQQQISGECLTFCIHLQVKQVSSCSTTLQLSVE